VGFAARKVLETDPKSVHLAHVLEDEINRIIHIATLTFEGSVLIGKDIFHHFHEVVSQEKTAGRLLNSLDHVEKIFQNQLDGCLFSLDVGRSDRDQKVEPGDNRSSVLDHLVKVGHLAALTLLFNKVGFQQSEFVEDKHI